MQTGILWRSALSSIRLTFICILAFAVLALPISAQPLPAPSSSAQPRATDVPPAELGNPAKNPLADTTDATVQDTLKLPTPEEIQQQLTTLENATIDEADKRKATEFYQQALVALGNLEQQRIETAHFEKLIADYPNDLEQFEKNLSELPAQVSPVDDDKSIAELEAEVSKRELELKQLRELLDDSNTKLKRRSDGLANFPKLVAEKQQELDRIKQQLEKAIAGEKTDIVSSAERSYLKAQAEALAETLKTLEKNREYYAMSGELAQVRRDYRAKKLVQDEKYLTSLRESVNQHRLAEANQQASAAASAAAVERPEAIAKLATANAALAQDQAAIVAKIAALDEKLATTNEQLEEVSEAQKLSVERVKAAGLTEASGQQLRQQQELLPDNQGIARKIALRETERSDAIYWKYNLLDQRNKVEDADLETRVAEILEQVPVEQRDAAGKEIRTLLESERKILDSTIDNYGKYIENLNNLTTAQDELIRTTREYREFIAEHVLWIRSCTWPRLADLEPAAGALAWSLNPLHWQEAISAFWARSRKSFVQVFLFVVVLVVSLYYHRQLRVRLREIGEQAAKRTCTQFWPSVEALWITTLLALPWPTLLGFVGWWIDNPLVESEFVRALSVGLKFTAICLLLLEFLRHLCRSGGVADAHFAWPQSCLNQIRRLVRGLIWMGMPLVLWLTGLEKQNLEALWSSTLGRACFVAVMLMVTLACYRVLLSSKSPFRKLLGNQAEKQTLHLYSLWAPLVTLLPLLLAALAIIGYYYTAQQLSLRLLQSAALLLSLLVVGGLTKRWILLNRRRLAREQAKQKRAAAHAAAVAASSDSAGEAPPVAEFIDDSVDLVALGEQTSDLIVSALVLAGVVSAWFIWQGMLPALAYIGQWPVFPGLAADALKWSHVFRFLLVLVASFVIIRNVPALLEFAVLQHLPMDSGARYAVTSICRYTLVAIAIVMAYKSLGFDGQSIQWLVAAMGVGLGFGLQEIFANFVSGIILLFERPIRVGDIVTLGDKTGCVSRIRMRATTLVDMERKEYIVPNKDFVTERLLNWTLSDQTIRIEILVGVAYGSDTELACRLLRETAAEHPHILKDPEPLANFFGFGDSALNLRLFAFISNLEKRLQTLHDLHTTIDKKFKAAGLEIAFPQTDLHVRSLPPEWFQQGAVESPPGQANGKASETASKSRDK